ncbi:MAG: hypothetical protein R3Y09_09760 [Clostridia bacterium]
MATVKRPIWFGENEFENMHLLMEKEDFKNESHFVNQAVEFYSGYLFTKNSTKFISNILLGEMQGLINSTEQRLKRLAVNNLISTETLIKMLEVDNNWTDHQVDTERQKARKYLFEGGDQ